MQRYEDITECIEMCDRILRTNTYPRNDILKDESAKIQLPLCSTTAAAAAASSSRGGGGPFHPSRTVAVQNFVPEAEVHVRSLVAMFGIVEVCEVVREDGAPSALALVQYKSRASAADALLAVPHCKVRSSHLVVNLLWNGPYSQAAAAAAQFRECGERRVVCVAGACEESVRRRCGRYGRVESVRVQEQLAFVVYQTALSAALATYCLRNSSGTDAALMLGYSEQGSPVLLGPIRVRPLDQYCAPLSAFDVRCVCTRFLSYSRLKGLFVQLHRRPPPHHFFRPGRAPEYCVRVPAPQARGVALYLEAVLFEGGVPEEDISEMAYQMCEHKYLFRFSVDFGLHKPVMSHGEERFPRGGQQFLRWNSFFVLDLQLATPFCPAQPQPPRLEPRLQPMNHIYSDLDPRAFDEDRATWFGVALRHSAQLCSAPPSHHRSWVGRLVAEGAALVRLAASLDDLSPFQIPVHVYSDSSTLGKGS